MSSSRTFAASTFNMNGVSSADAAARLPLSELTDSNAIVPPAAAMSNRFPSRMGFMSFTAPCAVRYEISSSFWITRNARSFDPPRMFFSIETSRSFCCTPPLGDSFANGIPTARFCASIISSFSASSRSFHGL